MRCACLRLGGVHNVTIPYANHMLHAERMMRSAGCTALFCEGGVGAASLYMYGKPLRSYGGKF